MTTAEQIKSISDQMRELREKRAELIEVRKTESEFKVGEKVKVYDKYGAEEVYLGKAYLYKIDVRPNNGIIYYQFRQVRYDGTESIKHFPTQGKVRLEKI